MRQTGEGRHLINMFQVFSLGTIGTEVLLLNKAGTLPYQVPVLFPFLFAEALGSGILMNLLQLLTLL